MSLRILVVCTGNICRSPLADVLLAERLADLPDVSVSSAGTFAEVGCPMDARAAEHARRLGADPSRHRARQLTESMIRSSGLVLAMADEHRRAVLDYEPSAARRTFTARRLARILDALPTDAADAAPAHAEPAAWLTTPAHAVPAAWLTGVAGAEPATSPSSVLIERAAAHPLARRRGDRVTDDIPDPYARSDADYAASVDLLVPAIDTIAAALRRRHARPPVD